MSTYGKFKMYTISLNCASKTSLSKCCVLKVAICLIQTFKFKMSPSCVHGWHKLSNFITKYYELIARHYLIFALFELYMASCISLLRIFLIPVFVNLSESA